MQNKIIKRLNILEDTRMEQEANLMSDCSVGKEQKQPVQHKTEGHQIAQGSMISPFLFLFQQYGWQPFQVCCLHKRLAHMEAPVRKQEKSKKQKADQLEITFYKSL